MLREAASELHYGAVTIYTTFTSAKQPMIINFAEQHKHMITTVSIDSNI